LEIGRDWERLGEIGRDWERLGRLGENRRERKRKGEDVFDVSLDFHTILHSFVFDE
jgi:hypothetical protein